MSKRRYRKRKTNEPELGLVRLAEVLPQLIAKYGIGQKPYLDRVAASWREAVGEPYSSVTRVVGLNRGTLEVAVAHNAFIQELSFRQKELLESLRAALHGIKVGKIRYVVDETLLK